MFLSTKVLVYYIKILIRAIWKLILLSKSTWKYTWTYGLHLIDYIPIKRHYFSLFICIFRMGRWSKNLMYWHVIGRSLRRFWIIVEIFQCNDSYPSTTFPLFQADVHFFLGGEQLVRGYRASIWSLKSCRLFVWTQPLCSVLMAVSLFCV